MHSDKNWLVEYCPIHGGLLSFDNLQTGETFMVGIKSSLTGRCVVRGQFKSSLKTHGIERTVETFRKLQVTFSTS